VKLQGKTALITGAGKGIGKAIAIRFAAEGAAVVVSDIDDEAAGSVTEEIKRNGGIAEPFHCDVLDHGDINRMVEFSINQFGKIDILVNNAGGAIVAGKQLPLNDTPIENLDRMLGINLMGAVYCSKAVVSHMIKRKTGKIINMGSLAGILGAGPIMYATAKAGIIGFTKALAVETAQYGITVNSLSPWAIATREGPANLPVRLPRKGRADEVASLAFFLVSEEADFITGSNIVIDGGFNTGGNV
jgi:NAD(P)-dependent dehydrogenase (short-subunit alcohol dehydrogenase family)